MARRKELGSLADGLVGSFVSRNNDVDGYWGVGQLYSFVRSLHTTELTIDLLTQELSPNLPQLACVARTYGQKLIRMLSAYGGCITWVQQAQITVTFSADSDGTMTRWGDPFTCTCCITDDRGQQYSVTATGYCRPHDPIREIRRLRKPR